MFFYQLVKKLQQWSFSEIIKGILPFVLKTKRPLSGIWLLRYKQHIFVCFSKKIQNFKLFKKHPKLICLYLSKNTLTVLTLSPMGGMHTLIQNLFSFCKHQIQKFWENLKSNFLTSPPPGGGY